MHKGCGADGCSTRVSRARGLPSDGKRRQVFGVDRAEGMLRLARASGNELLAVTDAQHLAIRSGTIDAVVLIFVLFHLPEPSRGLEEAYRVLRGDGMVGIATWGRDPGSPGLSIWREELDRDGADPDPRDPSVMQQAAMDTPEKLEQLLGAAGFVATNVWRTNVAHQWTLDDLLAVQLGCGMPARRLATLPIDKRAQCQARVRTRLERLSPSELEFRAEVLLAVARKGN